MKSTVVFIVAMCLLFGLAYWATQSKDVNDLPETVAMLTERANASAVSPSQNNTTKLDTEANASPDVVENPTLEIDRQKAIWELEHSTFELEWKFGKLVKEAIETGDREQLVACFQDGFVGRIPEEKTTEFVDGTSWNQLVIDVANEDQSKQVDGHELADFLLDEFSKLKEIKSVGLRVLKIDRVKATADDYHLTILLYAKGLDQGAPRSISSQHRLTVQFKNDQDIIAGKIVRRWECDSLTSRRANKPLFADVTKPAGLDKVDLPDNWKLPPLSQPDTYTSQIAVADYDQDGFLDIAIATLQGQQYLLRSIDGMEYEDVTEKMGLAKSRFASKTTLSTWIDYDNDNYPDLLIGKNLYHNEGGRKLKRVTSSAGLKFDAATLGAVVADYVCDGWLDFYVLNHFGKRAPNQSFSFVGDDDSSGAPNQLWRNLGNGKFQDVTTEAGIDGGARHSFAASWMHANDDHHPDLYVVNDFGRNLFFINRGDGSFEEIAEAAKVGDYANSMGVASGDLDNNGTTEIYVANMFSKMGRRIIEHVSEEDFNAKIYDGIRGACAGSHLYTLSKSATDNKINVKSTNASVVYDETSEIMNVNAIGWAYAPVFADFDADGLLDIYATSGFISVDRGKPDG